MDNITEPTIKYNTKTKFEQKRYHVVTRLGGIHFRSCSTGWKKIWKQAKNWWLDWKEKKTQSDPSYFEKMIVGLIGLVVFAKLVDGLLAVLL